MKETRYMIDGGRGFTNGKTEDVQHVLQLLPPTDRVATPPPA